MLLTVMFAIAKPETHSTGLMLYYSSHQHTFIQLYINSLREFISLLLCRLRSLPVRKQLWPRSNPRSCSTSRSGPLPSSYVYSSRRRTGSLTSQPSQTASRRYGCLRLSMQDSLLYVLIHDTYTCTRLASHILMYMYNM